MYAPWNSYVMQAGINAWTVRGVLRSPPSTGGNEKARLVTTIGHDTTPPATTKRFFDRNGCLPGSIHILNTPVFHSSGNTGTQLLAAS